MAKLLEKLIIHIQINLILINTINDKIITLYINSLINMNKIIKKQEKK